MRQNMKRNDIKIHPDSFPENDDNWIFIVNSCPGNFNCQLGFEIILLLGSYGF